MYNDVYVKVNNEQSRFCHLSDREVRAIKKELLKIKDHLCKSCGISVCPADRRTLSGPITDGIATDDEGVITGCTSYEERTFFYEFDFSNSDSEKYNSYLNAHICHPEVAKAINRNK